MRLKSLYSFELRPREPFDFHLMASCYNFNWWFDGSKCIVPLSSLSPLVAVTRQEELRLVVTVYGMRDWPEDVVKMVEHALGVNEDLAEFYRVAERDPLLYEVPKNPLRYEATCDEPLEHDAHRDMPAKR